MKKGFLLLIITIIIPLKAFCLDKQNANSINDSAKNKQSTYKALSIKGIKVFDSDYKLLNTSEVLLTLKSNPDQTILTQFNNGLDLRSGSMPLVITGSVLLACGSYYDYVLVLEHQNSLYNSNDYSKKMLYGGIVAAFGAISLASGIACKIVGKVEIRDAIYRYNKSSLLGNNNATTINYEIGFIPSGIGMRLTF